MRYSHRAWCDDCERETPRKKNGDCVVCTSKLRRAKRLMKAALTGKPLARFGDVLRVADELWSVWIRAFNYRCEMCGVPFEPKAMQCAHGFSREDRIIRFDPQNTFALCAACHRRHTPARQPWFDWMKQRCGEREYGRLEYASRVGGKLRQSDLELVILDAQSRITALPEGERKEWALERASSIGERMARLGVRAA
jgi:hypothetical protein